MNMQKSNKCNHLPPRAVYPSYPLSLIYYRTEKRTLPYGNGCLKKYTAVYTAQPISHTSFFFTLSSRVHSPDGDTAMCTPAPALHLRIRVTHRFFFFFGFRIPDSGPEVGRGSGGGLGVGTTTRSDVR